MSFESEAGEKTQPAYLDKAVVGGEVVPHRISPSLVVAFEEREESADLLQNLVADRENVFHPEYFEGAEQMLMNNCKIILVPSLMQKTTLEAS